MRASEDFMADVEDLPVQERSARAPLGRPEEEFAPTPKSGK
jgi:hypothetical protein